MSMCPAHQASGIGHLVLRRRHPGLCDQDGEDAGRNGSEVSGAEEKVGDSGAWGAVGELVRMGDGCAVRAQLWL